MLSEGGCETCRTAISDARVTIEVDQFAKQNLAEAIGRGLDPTAAFNVVHMRMLEVFQRLYGRARMENDGIDLDRFPELHTYQTYFELGMLPPTHSQMADAATSLLAPNPRPPIR